MYNTRRSNLVRGSKHKKKSKINTLKSVNWEKHILRLPQKTYSNDFMVDMSNKCEDKVKNTTLNKYNKNYIKIKITL